MFYLGFLLLPASDPASPTYLFCLCLAKHTKSVWHCNWMLLFLEQMLIQFLRSARNSHALISTVK